MGSCLNSGGDVQNGPASNCICPYAGETKRDKKNLSHVCTEKLIEIRITMRNKKISVSGHLLLIGSFFGETFMPSRSLKPSSDGLDCILRYLNGENGSGESIFISKTCDDLCWGWG